MPKGMTGHSPEHEAERAELYRQERDEALAACRAALPILEYIVENGWHEAPPLGFEGDEIDALDKLRLVV